jgi:hypothetical protein
MQLKLCPVGLRDECHVRIGAEQAAGTPHLVQTANMYLLDQLNLLQHESIGKERKLT